MKKKFSIDKIWHLSLLLMMVFSACNKDIALGTDPYAGGKQPLGVGFYANYAEPGSAKPGELVDFYVKGIKPFLGKLDFFVNNTKVEVVTAKDSLVTIKVPAEISSGDAKVVVDGEVFYGPRLEIDGNANRDDNFGIVNGFNASVYDILPNAGGFIVTGSFTNFENEAVEKKTFRSGIHFIGNNGKTSNGMGFGAGVNLGGAINSIAKTSDGKFIAGGLMSSFNKKQVFNLVKLNASGLLDTMIVDVINTTENPKNSLDTVSAFNAGVANVNSNRIASVLKVFAVADNKAIVVGNFNAHFKIDYTYSSRDNRKLIPTLAKDVIRLKADGSLDSTFTMENEGANSLLFDAALIDKERVLIVGPFTTFNGRPAKGIVCIKSDGTIDPSFVLNGTVDRVLSVSYNESLKKIAITGIFKGLGNGKISNVALLNTDGSIDNKFVFGEIGTDIANYAQVLNSGKVLVQGTFESYNGVPRARMLLLENDGSLLQKYNHQGPLTGAISKVVETKSALGEPALLIGGNIFQYGIKTVGNLFRLEVKE